MEEIFKKRGNETESQYIYRIGSCKDTYGVTWDEASKIINEQLGLPEEEWRGEAAYRKRYANYREAHDDVFVNSDIQEEIRELKKERIKLQTERVEYNRWLRDDAREELIAERITDAIKDLPKFSVPMFIPKTNGVREGTLIFADCHYGKELCIKGLRGETLNTYSPEIFADRMWNLLDQTITICKKEGFTSINVFDLGDEINGILRISDLMKLRYGLIESTVMYANFITNWLNELTKYVRVRFHMVSDSNHCQLRLLNGQKNMFREENVSYIIADKMMTRLCDNPNFEFVQNPSGYIFENIAGYNVFGYHGEGKKIEQAIKDFSNTYRTKINFLIGGHKHHKESINCGLEMDAIGVPSIIGIDDYSMSLNKTSDAGALLLVLEEGKGNVVEYNIKL